MEWKTPSFLEPLKRIGKKSEAKKDTNSQTGIPRSTKISQRQTVHDKAMRTLLDKNCRNTTHPDGKAHHPELIQFIGACNSIGIPEHVCREFLHVNTNVISPESSYHENSRQLEDSIKDIYKRYSSEFGKYKSQPIQQLPSISTVNLPDEIQVTFPSPISPKVYENLPDLLRRACNILSDKVEREVFLMAAIGFLSGCLPNVWMNYDGQRIESNLYIYLTTSAGGGKGSVSFAWLLVKAIHEQKREAYKAAKIAYKQELKQYKKDIQSGIEREEPVEPKNQMLLIPANNSATGAIELLDNNEGRGIIFETEGDTLANTFKMDYGNYSDSFRKAFHHERISYYRRTDKEEVEIDKPYLSTILSSTFDQLLKLIPSAENGLFSRFIFYMIQPNPEFKKVFDKQKNSYQEVFLKIGGEVSFLYQILSNMSEGTEFRFTDVQIERFYSFFQAMKNEVNDSISEKLNGTVNRLGVITARIAMIFTTLRIFESGDITDHLTCSDQDFENAIHLIEILQEHAIHIFEKLPSGVEAKHLKSELKRKVYKMLPDEFFRKDVEPGVANLGMNERAFTRFLKLEELFIKIKHGHYRKRK